MIKKINSIFLVSVIFILFSLIGYKEIIITDGIKYSNVNSDWIHDDKDSVDLKDEEFQNTDASNIKLYDGVTVDGEEYKNNKYFVNVHFINPVLRSKDHGAKKMFNDDEEGATGEAANESPYLPFFELILPPNIITYRDFNSINISFTIMDTWKKKFKSDQFYGDFDEEVKNLHMTVFENQKDNTGASGTGNKLRNEDTYYYYDDFAAIHDRKSENYYFRAIYVDNDITKSDKIVVYSNFAYQGNASRSGNNDALKTSFNEYDDKKNLTPLSLTGDFIVDSMSMSSMKINESNLMELVIEKIIKNDNDDFYDEYKYDPSTSGFKKKGSDDDFIDKINFDFKITYKELIDFLFKKGEDGKSLFQNSVSFSEGLYADQDVMDFVFYEDKKELFTINGKDLSIESFGEGFSDEKFNNPLESSSIKFKIIKNDDFKGKYKDVIVYNPDGWDHGYGPYDFDLINGGDSDNPRSTINLNLPFFKWELTSIPAIIDDTSVPYKTTFGEETNFYIEPIDTHSFFKDDVEINIDTNTNLNFKINGDPNIVFVKQNNIKQQEHDGSKWDMSTNFNDNDIGLEQGQEEKFTIRYRQTISEESTGSPIDQNIHININFDPDSVVSNNNKDQAIEDIQGEKNTIKTMPLAYTTNEDSLDDIDAKDDFNIIDYYQVKNDFTWNFSKEQLNLISDLNPLVNYYKSSSSSFSSDSETIKISPSTIINGIGNLYRFSIDLKTSIKYDYWINISSSFMDYGEDDGIDSNNHIPIEWKELEGNGLEYNKETDTYILTLPSFGAGPETTYYIRDYFETAQGKDFQNKAIKKGWLKSEIKTLQSYMIKSMYVQWDDLIDFKYLNIDPNQLTIYTESLYEKEKNKFKNLKPSLDKIIDSQLQEGGLQRNPLNHSDYIIKYSDLNGEEFPPGKIIKNKDVINVEINSTRYGKGINNYKFSFKPQMIEPTPMWIKLTIGVVVTAFIAIVSLLSFGFYKRNKNRKIKG